LLLKGIGIAVIFAWGAKQIISRKYLTSGLSNTFYLSLILFLWGLTSGLWLEHLTESYFLALLSYISLLVWFFFLDQVVTSTAKLENLLKAFVFSAAFSASIACWEYSIGTASLAGRALGGMNDPNELAAMLASAIPLAMSIMSIHDSKAQTAIYSVLISVLVLGVVVTGSRMGIIVMLVAIIAPGSWTTC
jgi:hypothetical protein